MGTENSKNGPGSVFSKAIRAGRRRTYFFDVRSTKGNDFYVTITESKKKFNEDGYERHKVFLYKEDFNKFLEALNDTINHVKTDLLPEYDFDEFSHSDDYYENNNNAAKSTESEEPKVESSETTSPPPPAPAPDSTDAPEVNDDDLKL